VTHESQSTAWSYLTLEKELLDVYHHHKENMANAGFIVQLGLFGAVVSPDVWPPAWVSKAIIAPRVGTWCVYLALWLILHMYVRWQVQNKRIAAILVGGITNCMLHWIQQPPTNDDLRPFGKDLERASGFMAFLHSLFSLPDYQVRGDLDLSRYPKVVGDEVLALANKGTGAITHESLLTWGSWLLLALASMRIFLS
jgi:hypothetical protein